MKTEPRTPRGRETRRCPLEFAEQVFAELGYPEASGLRITERVGIGQGTFYLYFGTKLKHFNELVEDLNRRVPQAMSEGAHEAADRIEAEHISPRALRLHCTRIVEASIDALESAKFADEIGDVDSVGSGTTEVPEHVLDKMMRFIQDSLSVRRPPAGSALAGRATLTTTVTEGVVS